MPASKPSRVRRNEPLGIPKGSVRAVLAILIVVGFLAGRAPEAMASGVLIAYFGSRSK